MNAALLLEYYERIAEAPDAIARLRRFILDLAVRGKLVPQDPNDESPQSALIEARLNLQQAAERASRMRWKSTEPVQESEIDKAVPHGWVAARVNDIGLYINGLAFKPADWKRTGKPIIRIQNLTDPARDFNYAEGSFPDEVIVRDGDILVSWSATLEAFRWSRGEGVLNQHIFRVIPAANLTEQDFLLLLLRNAIREMSESEHAHGFVMSHINRGPFLNHIVLIPPRAEQRRIAEKFSEMMALCDQLDAAQAEREGQRDKLTLSTLAKLSEPDPETFAADARFALEHLEPLTISTDQIKQLRQTILNLAVDGKLVEQDPNDEPASEQLLRIALAKSTSQKAKQATRDSKRTAATDCPDSLPSGWAMSNLGELALSMRYGTSIKCEHEVKGAAVLRIPNVSGGAIDLNDLKYGPLNEKEQRELALEAGDLLLIRSNGSLSIVGRCAVVTPEAAGISFAGYLVRVRLLRDEVDPRYLWLSLNSSKTRDCIEKPIRSAVGLKNVNLTEFGALSVPLPPLAEQQRIVGKVDALMELCNHLEASLTQGQQTRSKLLEAVLHEALEPA